MMVTKNFRSEVGKLPFLCVCNVHGKMAPNLANESPNFPYRKLMLLRKMVTKIFKPKVEMLPFLHMHMENRKMATECQISLS